MSSGLKYISRLLRGESPKSVIKSMPEEDFEKVKEFIGGLSKTPLNRSQRRKIERKMKTVSR